MNEDEELYRLMNEEDNLYMGDSEEEETTPSKKLNVFSCFGVLILAGILACFFVAFFLMKQTITEHDNSTEEKNSLSSSVIEGKIIFEPIAEEIIVLSRPHNYTLSDRIVSDITTGVKKVEYIIVIDKKYSEKELDEIADYIKSTDKDKIEYIFVSSYLSHMSLNGLNYAISIRTPDLNSTKINYVEPAKESKKQKAPYAGLEIIGKWQMVFEATTTIYKKGNTYYMADQYSEDSYGDPEKLIRFTVNGKTAFKFAEDTGEVFVIMKDGLYGYMDGDLSCVFSNVK